MHLVTSSSLKPFDDYLKKRLKGIRILPFIAESYYPGKIFSPVSFSRSDRHIREHLRLFDAGKWHLDKMVNYNLLYGKKMTGITRKTTPFSMFGVLSFPQDPGKKIEVEYEVAEMFAIEFFNTSELELLHEVNRLKYNNKTEYRKIRNLFLVTESFYIKNFTLRIRAEFRDDTEAGSLVEMISYDPEIRLAAPDPGTITVYANEKYPYGVRGFVL